jgi:hypothetical protein
MPEPISLISHFVRATSESHADYQSKTGITLLSKAPEGYGGYQSETQVASKESATKMQLRVLTLGKSFHRAPARLRNRYTSDTDTTFQTAVVFEAYHHSSYFEPC